MERGVTDSWPGTGSLQQRMLGRLATVVTETKLTQQAALDIALL